MQLWISSLAYSSMADFLLLGLELGLYDPHEYATVFLYGDHLLSLCFRHLHGLFTARPKEAKKTNSNKKGKDGKGVNGKKNRPPPQVTWTPGASQLVFSRITC